MSDCHLGNLLKAKLAKQNESPAKYNFNLPPKMPDNPTCSGVSKVTAVWILYKMVENPMVFSLKDAYVLIEQNFKDGPIDGRELGMFLNECHKYRMMDKHIDNLCTSEIADELLERFNKTNGIEFVSDTVLHSLYDKIQKEIAGRAGEA